MYIWQEFDEMLKSVRSYFEEESHRFTEEAIASFYPRPNWEEDKKVHEKLKVDLEALVEKTKQMREAWLKEHNYP